MLTYSQLQDAADRAASLLSSLGVAPGDRVGIMLPNVPAFPIAYYGALGAGATVVPMNPLLKNREVAYYLGDSGAKVLVAWHEAAAEAAQGAAGTGVQVIEVDEPDMHTLLARLSPAAKRADQASDDNAVIRLQRLPARDRGRPARASSRRRGRRHRHPAYRAGRGSRRRRGAQAGNDGHPRGTSGFRQGTGGGLQVSAPCLARPRPAQGPYRQDPAPRSAAAARPPAVTVTPRRAWGPGHRGSRGSAPLCQPGSGPPPGKPCDQPRAASERIEDVEADTSTPEQSMTTAGAADSRTPASRLMAYPATRSR